MANIKAFEENTLEYDDWFEKNQPVYQSELKAIRALLPVGGKSIEIGVGTGRFATPLGIKYGIEPSAKMGEMAKRRGIHVVKAVGENLPIADSQFGVVLIVTTICFLDNVKRVFEEVYRILRANGALVVGFVDKNSLIGMSYEKNKEKSAFYSSAVFYSIEEVIQLMAENGFQDFKTVQTIFRPLSETKRVDTILPGHGKGSFLVVRGFKY